MPVMAFGFANAPASFQVVKLIRPRKSKTRKNTRLRQFSITAKEKLTGYGNSEHIWEPLDNLTNANTLERILGACIL